MSGRDVTTAFANAIIAPVVYVALLYEGEFEMGVVRLWTGIGPLDWDSKTWTGAGHLLSISPVGENAELRADGFEVKLSGMPSTSLAVALTNLAQGKPGRVWLAAFTADWQIIPDPYELQAGKLDVMPIDIAADRTATISARYEGEFIDLDTPRNMLYTHEDQQLFHPGDTGFRFMTKLNDATIIYGGPGAAASQLATPLLLTNAR